MKKKTKNDAHHHTRLMLERGLWMLILVWLLAMLFTPSNLLHAHVYVNMIGVPTIPESRCDNLHLESEREKNQFYDAKRAETLAYVLSAPYAHGLEVDERLQIFSTALGWATGTQDGAHLLDMQNGAYLISMNLAVCGSFRRSDIRPPLYVYTQTGDYYAFGSGELRNFAWMEDRWAGIRVIGGDGKDLYSFVHIAHQDGEWRMLEFNVPHAPNLSNLALQDPYDLTYLDSYHEITYTASPTTYGSPPCTLGDIPSLDSSSVTVRMAVYTGNLTYQWMGDNYILTDKTPFTVHLTLSDNTQLHETPSHSSLPRSDASWRDYCLDSPIRTVSLANRFEYLEGLRSHPCALLNEYVDDDFTQVHYIDESIMANGHGVIFIKRHYGSSVLNRYALIVCDLLTGDITTLFEEAWIVPFDALTASPDGEWFSFGVVITSPRMTSHIYRIRHDGTDLYRLDTQGLPHLHTRDMAWSDGMDWLHLIIVDSIGEGMVDRFYRLRTDGSGYYEVLND